MIYKTNKFRQKRKEKRKRYFAIYYCLLDKSIVYDIYNNKLTIV